MGKAYGVSAGDGEVHFTVRSDSNANESTRTSLEKLAQSIAKEHQLECNILWTEGFKQTKIIKSSRSHQNCCKKLMILKYWKRNSLLLGEDFGFYPAISWRDVWPWLWNKHQPFIIQTTIFLMIISTGVSVSPNQQKLRMHTNSIIELNRTAYQKTSFLKTTFGKKVKISSW
jgi:metal-dependent amidase/aminoacylase/carboxypeptidase family protein